jgi:hypothetical protein
MKVVQIDDVPLKRGLEHRGGTYHSRELLEGQPGTLGNFKFSISDISTDFASPRHRHNFEQYRFMLEGECDFGRDGVLKAGMLGYFPEGVHYGPQVNKTPISTAVVQFGGASGSGYLLPREVKSGMVELEKFGEFKGGIFHRRDDVPGKRNMDAYQAIWEHVNQRSMEYPKGRYDAPVFMDSANFQWAAVKGAKGVSEKLFGVFTERRTGARILKLEAGASYPVEGRSIFLVLSGTGEIDGQPLRRRTSVFLDQGEKATLRAAETTELLQYELPDLSDMASGYDGAAMQAAE